MNKYFNISLTRPNKSDMNNYNYNFDVVFVPIPPATYFPLTNTAVNPVYYNTGNTGQVHNGQSYTFVPYDGLYFDAPPTSFYQLFRGSPVNDPDVGLWDVSNITEMNHMFNGSSFNQPIGDWDVSNVTTMLNMFYGSSFNQDIGNWDVSNVGIMAFMFAYAQFNQDIGGWNTIKVTTMQSMFHGNSNFNQDIGGWNVANVTNMANMFNQASNFNQDLRSGWCVSKIGTTPTGFSVLSPLTLPPLWGTCPTPLAYFPLRNTSVNPVYNNNGNIRQSINGQYYKFVPNDGLYFDNWPTNFGSLFNGKMINDPDIGLWDVSNVTMMASVFNGSNFNQDISGWNVSNVTHMNNMFQNALIFNQDLSGWCVTNITSEPTSFSTGSPLIPANKPVWGTCP